MAGSIFDITPLGLPIRFAGAAFSPAALGGSAIPLDAYGNVDINAVGRQLAPPVKLPLPMNEKGEIDLPSAAEQLGDYAYPEQAEKRKEESEEKEEKTETDTSSTDASSDTSAEGSDSSGKGPLYDQEPDVPFSEVVQVAREFLDRYPAIRREEREAEMQRYVLQGALRQRGLRELSRRQIESENIKAWKDLQVAREQARAAQAISLASTAYLAGIPNEGTMAAMNNAMKSAMQQITIQAPGSPQRRNLFS